MTEHESKRVEKSVKKGKIERTGSFLLRHRFGLIGSTMGSFAIDQAVNGNIPQAAIGAGISLATLGVEGIELLGQRTDTCKNAPLGSLSTKGFKLSPNPTAETLASYTDISFKKVPKKIVYTSRNKLVLLGKDPIMALYYSSSLKKNEAIYKYWI